MSVPALDLKAQVSEINRRIAAMPFGLEPVELYEPIRYLMNLGGKRMRPVLSLLGASLFTDDLEAVYTPAIGVEVFHNFTLMHDDIMDQAPLRRNLPTVHEKWNTNIAILSGDVMLVQAYRLVMQVPDNLIRPVLELFNETAEGVCQGQQLDMNFEQLLRVSQEDYIEMIRLKTAVLLGFSLELGALVGGAWDRDAWHLRQAGMFMGIGFQLKDDLLDVYGSPDKFGKQVGGDIIANKKTFLLIQALEKAQGPTLRELERWLSLSEFDKAEKVAAVTQIYNELDIPRLAKEQVNLYFYKGMQEIERVGVEPARKAALLAYAEDLIARES